MALPVAELVEHLEANGLDTLHEPAQRLDVRPDLTEDLEVSFRDPGARHGLELRP